MTLALFKKFFSDRNTIILSAAIILLILLRVLILPMSPPGFYVDESASGAHIVSMVNSQTNAHGQTWPFYSSSLGGGFTTPIYLYPVSLWAAIFGTSELAIRAFSQFATIIAIFVIGFGVKFWFDKKTALIAIIVGLALPWGWLQGSLAWDPALVPLFSSLAFLGWSMIINGSSKRTKLAGKIILPIGLLLLAYVYPPYWVSSPILFIATYGSLLIIKKISLKSILYTAGGMLIGVLPLINFILQPSSLNRSSSISIFSGHSIIEAIGLFFGNIFMLINPIFLFVSGDSNSRHSTGQQGMLGVGAMIPIAMLVILVGFWIYNRKVTLASKKQLFLLTSVFIGFLICLIGSALTSESQPHSLRACGAWPFAVILITIGWYYILKLKNKWLIYASVLIFISATSIYAYDLAINYPERTKYDFSVPMNNDIKNNVPGDYMDLVLKYFREKK